MYYERNESLALPPTQKWEPNVQPQQKHLKLHYFSK